MDNVKVADDYKDRLFRMIFNDKEKLLELYNAMNRSDYTDASELQVVTLENAIYLSMKMYTFVRKPQRNLEPPVQSGGYSRTARYYRKCRRLLWYAFCIQWPLLM